MTVAAAALFCATNAPAVFYPVLQDRFGLSPFEIAAVYASYPLALIPALILTGSLAHVIGYRWILMLAWAISASGAAVFALTTHPGGLYLGRSLQGVATGLATGAIAATLLTLEPRSNSRRAALATTLAVTVGCGLGPLPGGVVARFVALPDRVTLLGYAAVLLGCVAGFAALPRGLGRTTASWQPRLPRLPDETRRWFLLVCANAVVTWCVAGVYLGLAPSYVRAATGTHIALLGVLPTSLSLVCAGATQVALVGRAARWSLQAGLALVVLGMWILVLGGSSQSVLLILASAPIAGAGLGAAFLGGAAEATRICLGRADAAGVYATYSLATYSGTSIPILGVGLLGNAVGQVTATFVLAIAVTVVGLAWAVAAGAPPRRDGPLPSRRGSVRRR